MMSNIRERYYWERRRNSLIFSYTLSIPKENIDK
jgi:hypothetical protein